MTQLSQLVLSVTKFVVFQETLLTCHAEESAVALLLKLMLLRGLKPRLSEGQTAFIKPNQLKLFSKNNTILLTMSRLVFHVNPEAHRLWIILHQVRCLSLIFRQKTRGSDSSCHHACSPAALYSGQWCFVSRSRSNASHQTIWTRASNWASKVSTISSAGSCQPVFSVLNMQDWPGAFHGPLSFF